jgi:hypothetical protein
MKMIATVICRKKLSWMKWIVRSRILIDHGIAATGLAAEKGIDLFACYLSRRSPVTGSLIRRQGGTGKLDLFLVSSANQTL